MFGMASVFVNLSETMAGFGFLVCGSPATLQQKACQVSHMLQRVQHLPPYSRLTSQYRLQDLQQGH